MLTKRIIPCLDVKNNKVVKGVRFKNHIDVGNILDLATKYSIQNADEIVFYDITASIKNETVNKNWVKEISQNINIPFCVAGGIKTVDDARDILNNGADKISINTPAIENPALITKLAKEFGSQCVVVGIDSFMKKNDYFVFAKTGCEKSAYDTKLLTKEWIKQTQDLGAGEIVLNCMNNDGVRNGYDIEHINMCIDLANIPIIASGGAGDMNHFYDVFTDTNASGALAASVFHKDIFSISELKKYLVDKNIHIRI